METQTTETWEQRQAREKEETAFKIMAAKEDD